MKSCGINLDPDDIEYCEHHDIQYIAGDECEECAKEAEPIDKTYR